MKTIVTNGVSRVVDSSYKVEEFPELKIVICTRETSTNDPKCPVIYCVMAFSGKKSSPDFNYYYRTEEHRYNKVTSYLKRLEEIADSKAKKRKEKKEYQTTLQVGDILQGSWGYDQTNQEFYQVVEKISGKMVKVRELCQQYVEGSQGFMSENVLPIKDSFKENSKPERKLVGVGDRISYQCFSLSKWDGRPCYQSHYA